VKKLVENNKDFNTLMNEYKQGVADFVKITYTVLGDMKDYLGNYELRSAGKVSTAYETISARKAYSDAAVELMTFIFGIKKEVQKNPAFFNENTINKEFFDAMKEGSADAVSQNDLKAFMKFSHDFVMTYQDFKKVNDNYGVLAHAVQKLAKETVGHERYARYEEKADYLLNPAWKNIDALLWGKKATLVERMEFLQAKFKTVSDFFAAADTPTILKQFVRMSDNIRPALEQYKAETEELKQASEDYVKYGIPLEHIADFHKKYDALLKLDTRPDQEKEDAKEEAKASNDGFLSNIFSSFENFRWSSGEQNVAPKGDTGKKAEEKQASWKDSFWNYFGDTPEATPEAEKPQETPSAPPKEAAVMTTENNAPKVEKVVVGKHGLKDAYTQDVVHGGFQAVLDFLTGTAKAECYAHVIRLMQQQSSCVIRYINSPNDQEKACTPYMDKAMMAAEQCETVFNMASSHDEEIMRLLTESAEVNLEVDDNEQISFAAKHDKATLLLNYVYQPQTLAVGAGGENIGSNMLGASYTNPDNIAQFKCVDHSCEGQPLALDGH